MTNQQSWISPESPIETNELIGLPSRGREMLTGAWGTPKAASLDSSVVLSIPPSLRGCQKSPGPVLIDAQAGTARLVKVVAVFFRGQ